jgi:hypothetical protein
MIGTQLGRDNELVNIGQLKIIGKDFGSQDWSPHSFIQTHGRINETQGWSPREDPSRWWSKLFSTLIQVPLLWMKTGMRNLSQCHHFLQK